MNLFESFRLKKFALDADAQFINLSENRDFTRIYAEELRFFTKEVASRGDSSLRSRLQKALVGYKNPEEIIEKMYDIEYGEDNYAYLSALLLRKGFEIIAGYKRKELPALQILDVGAGSNEFLRFCKAEYEVPAEQLWGVDISTKSKEIIEGDGFNGFAGRIEQLSLPREFFDLVLLSYFIDYDTDQRSTFKTAVALVKPGGKIIFEGLLPCIPGGGQNYTDNFVTRGKNSIDDARLIFESFASFAKEKKYTLTLERVVLGYRYIHNQLGLKKRRSYFFVYGVNSG
jgi:SAM-dependent methyltransferase